MGEKQPEYAGRLLDRDLHLSDFQVPEESSWAGKSLKELDLGKKYDVHVASIIRGKHRVNIPTGDTCIFPNDTLQVIGTDEQLSAFAEVAEKATHTYDDEDFEKHEMKLKQFVVGKNSPFIGYSIVECGIRDKYHCLVVGVESAGEDVLRTPQVHAPFKENDVVWVVGEENDLNKLFTYSY